MIGRFWVTITAALLFAGMVSGIQPPARAKEIVQSFCAVAKSPQAFAGKTVRLRAVEIKFRAGTSIQDADNLIVTSASCGNLGFISDTKFLLANAPKERRFEFVGKLIGGQLTLGEISGMVQPSPSPHLMAKLAITSVSLAADPPGR